MEIAFKSNKILIYIFWILDINIDLEAETADKGG